MSCATETKKSVNLVACNEWPSQIKTGIWTPNNFTIPAATAADPVLLKAYMQAALTTTTLANRIYQYPIMDLVTDVSEAKVRVNQASGRTIPVREGLKRFDIEWSLNMCFHRAMFTHRTRTGRWIIVDFNDKYVFTKQTSGVFSGFKLSLFDTDSIRFNTGAAPSVSPAFLELANPNELNQNGYMTDASFTDELNILADATVTQVAGTTTVITVDVKISCDDTPILGLVTADFVVKTAAGATQTVVAAAVAATPGRYTLTGTALVTGTVQVISTSLYESAVTVETIPFP